MNGRIAFLGVQKSVNLFCVTELGIVDFFDTLQSLFLIYDIFELYVYRGM